MKNTAKMNLGILDFRFFEAEFASPKPRQGVCQKLTLLLVACLLPFVGLCTYDSFTGIGTVTYNGIRWRYRTLYNGNKAYVGAGQSTDSSDWRAIPRNTTGSISVPSVLEGRTISGLYDYAFQDCSGITSVAIPTTITSLGFRAFKGCSGLVSVDIPNSVTAITCYQLSGNGFKDTAFPDCANIKNVSISPRFEFSTIFPASYRHIEVVSMPGGESVISNKAFAGCSSLRTVNFASDIKRIGVQAFEGCVDLCEISLPDGLTVIDSSAFLGCNGLTKIVIPDSVSTIANAALSGCSNLREISVAPKFQLSQIMSTDCARITNVIVSINYNYIGSSEFANCTGLKSFIIPEHIISLKDSAFNGCSGLGEMTIPCNVESLGEGVFAGCSGLTNVTLSTSITKLPKNTFKSCSNLKRIEIPEGVTEIAEGAFDGCSLLSSVKLPTTLKKIGVNAFRNCMALTELEIPDSVVEISASAFIGCTAIVAIEIPSRFVLANVLPSSYQKVNAVVFSGCEESIANGALSGCSAVTSVSIPCAVTNIGASTFYGCAALESIVLPQNLQSLNDGVFEGCTKLRSISIPVGVVTIPDRCFRNCTQLEEIEFPANVRTIGAESFGNCTSLSSLSLPDSVVAIALSAFAGCDAIDSIRIPACFVISDVLPDSYQTLHSVEYPSSTIEITTNALAGCTNLSSMTIPASVVKIGKGAFESCCGIETVLLPNGVKTIEEGCFANCVGLKTVTFPNLLSSIEAFAFEGCTSLTEISLPDSLTGLGYKAFYGCSQLKSVRIPGMVQYVGHSSFGGCSSLTAIVLEEGIKGLGPGAFDGCGQLKSISLPMTLESLGDANFRELVSGWEANSRGFWIESGWVLAYEDDQVSTLQIPEGVKGIAPWAFSDFWDLEEVVLPESLRYIGFGSFMNDTGLDNVVIPDGVEYIDDYAFKNCTYLRNMAIGDGVREIGDEAFGNCTQFTALSIPDSVESIGDRAFSNCWRMLSVKLPLGLKNIGSGMFSKCTSLVGVSVPLAKFTMSQMFEERYNKLTSAVVVSGETDVCTNAFAGCTALASVTIPEGITNIQCAAFKNCTALSSVGLPETVEAIGDQAFYGCSALSAIVLPDSVRTIGRESFRNCSSLKNVTLSRNLGTLPDYAFYGCNRLTSMVVSDSVRELGAYIGNYITSLYFLGNAPSYDANAYGSMPGSMTTYVVQGSRGWDGVPSSRDLPQKWIGRNITFWTPNRFNAIFNANGGKFHNEAETYACEEITDTSYAIPPFEPTRTGYAFAGWWTDATEGAQVKATTRVVETRDTTFYAHWTLINTPVTVRFNANGGTVSPDEVTYFAGLTYETFPIPAKEHYVFCGWFTRAVGGEQVYAATEVPAAGAELFAHWTPATYSIKYNANGGSGYMPDQTFTYGSDVTLRANAFHKTDSSFTGWGIAAEGPVVYADMKTISTLGAIQGGVITLYAQWTAARYAVRYDSNGGIGSMNSDTFTNGVTQALSSNVFTRAGYVFVGWSRTANGEVDYVDGENVKDIATSANEAVSLFAVWGRNTSNVTFSFGGDQKWRPARFVRNGEVVWQSGTICDNQTSMMETVVRGSGTIAFDWQSSCEDSFRGMRLDYLMFSIDGVEKTFVNGLGEWATVSFVIEEPGEHVLRWVYSKDTEGSDHEDCGRVTTVTWTPHLNTLGEFVNAGAMNFSTGGNAPWFGQVVVTHDSAGALRSGAISDGELSRLQCTVSGPGDVSFWWKVSSEAPFRGMPLDYVSFCIDGVEKEWIAGETDWTNAIVKVEGDGTHILSWTYQKDDWEGTSDGEDCAWLDEVTWTPTEAIPQITSDSEVAEALEGTSDRDLTANVTNAVQYAAYRAWALSVTNGITTTQTIKESTRTWLSYAFAADALIEKELTSDDVKIESFAPASTDGKFEFTVSVKDVNIGGGSVAVETLKENLKRVLGIEGSANLSPGGFSSDNIDIIFDTPVDGKARFTVTPPVDAGSSFFMRVKVK